MNLEVDSPSEELLVVLDRSKIRLVLDNLLSRNLKELLIPLVEDLSLEERARLCRRGLQGLESG